MFREGTPFLVHYTTFIPAILIQGTKEQQANWLDKAMNGKMIGSYAQVSKDFLQIKKNTKFVK